MPVTLFKRDAYREFDDKTFWGGVKSGKYNSVDNYLFFYETENISRVK